MENIFKIELREFLSKLADDIEQGVNIELRNIVGEIEVEVILVQTMEAEGKVRLYVVDGKGNYSNEKTTKVKFKFSPKMSESTKRTINGIIDQNSKQEGLMQKIF